MGIQDKIFDIASALEGKPEAKDFDDLIAYIGGLESRLDTYRDVAVKYGALLTSLEKHQNILKHLTKE